MISANEMALKENLVDKEHVTTLTEFQASVDQAKMNAAEEGTDTDPIWVETHPKICLYYNRRGLGKAGYFDFQGVKVCEFGKSEEIKARLSRQIDQINHPQDAHVNGVESSRMKAGA